jgi:hypothetical protein
MRVGLISRVFPAIVTALAFAATAHAQSALFENWKDEARPRAPKGACADLISLTGYEFSLDSATAVAAEGDRPGFCIVQGQILPEVQFEVALPSQWNGRLYMFGNGGFAGESLSAAGRVAMRDAAIRRGFATAQTNTGHSAAREPLATFASDPQKLIDYAYRAVHVTAMTAKTLARAYYDAAPARSYFFGCSTGGRQGLISAQRFPDDFDGIVVGAPVLDFTGTMVHFAAINRALAAAPVPAERVNVIAEKVYQKCDAADGLVDGLLEDPRRCTFDIAADVPRCSPGGETDACLTESQVKALSTVYSGVTAQGTTVFPGFPVGAEALVPTSQGRRSGWQPWIISEGQQTIALQFAESFFKEMVTPGTPIDWRQFDIERDGDRLARIATLLNAKNPDLTRFKSRGGKILMYFGWADPALNPMMGINYYEQVRQRLGATTSDFFRLFMMPGVLHCAGGNGPSASDFVTPLVEWVEKGVAPDRLVASLRRSGKTILTRPLCAYPSTAKYNGSGSKDEAGSFACVSPQPSSSSPQP